MKEGLRSREQRREIREDQLPCLLYVGDVPVESSYHGSALIYRLLQNYPAERLRIIEGNLRNSFSERRLAGVPYRAIRVGWNRPLYTRLSPWARLLYSKAARWRIRAVESALSGFQPEAVLTVAHDFLWLTAARFARRYSLPLHLICHDDLPRTANVPSAFRGWLEAEFRGIYRQAASRLCVSPYMAEEYKRRYGVSGTVLYPSRANDTPVYDAEPASNSQNGRPFTLAYAGTLSTVDYIRQLTGVSKLLSSLEGKLLLFGPFESQMLCKAGMDLSCAKIGGLLSSADLVRRLHKDADVLLLPMSFSPSDQEAMALNFPSKLTDYTAAALPLLIWGPETCSAVKWARNERDVAAVVTDPNPDEMAATLKQLKEDSGWRGQLAANAVKAGLKYFRPTIAKEVFIQAVQAGGFSLTAAGFNAP